MKRYGSSHDFIAILADIVALQIEGIATIRAFNWQRSFVADNVRKLDIAQTPHYNMQCIQRWLNLVLDLLVGTLAIMFISLAVGLKGTTSGGQVGIALNVIIAANTSLLRLVESWTQMETSLGAISRLKNFERDVLPEDKPGEDQEPPERWPAKGAIEFQGMSAAYG